MLLSFVFYDMNRNRTNTHKQTYSASFSLLFIIHIWNIFLEEGSRCIQAFIFQGHRLKKQSSPFTDLISLVFTVSFIDSIMSSLNTGKLASEKIITTATSTNALNSVTKWAHCGDKGIYFVLSTTVDNITQVLHLRILGYRASVLTCVCVSKLNSPGIVEGSLQMIPQLP